MSISKKQFQLVMYLTAVTFIVPLLIFPSQLGTELVRTTWTGLALELVFYCFVAYFFRRQTSLMRLLGAGGLCLIYRFALGSVVGLTIVALYSMDIGVAWTLAVSSYLPIVLFQMLLTPIALRPVLAQILAMDETSSKPSRRPTRESQRSEPRKASGRPVRPIVVGEAQLPPTTAVASGPVSEKAADLNGFDRAVRYIGELGSVQLAAVVDGEGLTMASFARNGLDIDAWAPLALLFIEGGAAVVQRTRLDGLERVDLQLETYRVVVTKVGEFYLMAVADRQDEELLSIRLNQAMETINKYVAERYGDKLNINAESIHV